MKNFLFILLLLASLANAFIIKPQSISHRSAINDIKIYGNKVYTVSNDNTLKVWNKNSLSLENTLYEKESGRFGNLYTIESNGKFILTAGITGNDNAVFIHDKKTLKVLKELKHDFYAVNKLQFSPTKNILAIASGSSVIFYDKNLKFMDRKNFYDYEKKFSESIYDITFLDNHTVALVNWDGFIFIYNFKNRKIVLKKRLDTRLQSIKFINGKIYTGGYDGYLYVFSKKLKLIKKIFIGLNFDILHIVNSKKYIALAGSFGGFAVLKNDKILFKKSLAFCKGIAIDKDNFYVANRNILQKYHLSKLQKQTPTNIETQDSISLGDTDFDLNFISIKSNLLKKYTTLSNTHKIDGITYHYEITTTTLPNDTLLIYKNKKVGRFFKDKLVTKFKRDVTTGYKHNVAIWYKHYIISGGDYGYVFVYDVLNNKTISIVDDLKDHIVDLDIKNDVLAILDLKGDIHLCNLEKLSSHIKPYLTITFFKNQSFLLRSGEYFYTNDLSNVVCLKETRLNQIKTTCIPDKEVIKEVIHSKKRFEKNSKVVDLRKKSLPIQMDEDIDFVFNTQKYIIVGDSVYYALNKQTKKLKKIPEFYGGYIGDVLEKDGYIYILKTSGNVYKYDSNLNFITKTNFKPNLFSAYPKSYHLDIYKNHLVSRFQNYLYIYDDNLLLLTKSQIHSKHKNRFFWTFIGDDFYQSINNTLRKYNLKTAKSSSIPIDEVYIKTHQNRIVVKIKDCYYTVDKNLNKSFLYRTKKDLHFFNGKKSFYAISWDNDVLKCIDDRVLRSSYIDKKYKITPLGGFIEFKDDYLFTKIGLVTNDLYNPKIVLFNLNTPKKVKTLLQSVKKIQDIKIYKKYIFATTSDNLFVYTKDLKLVKRFYTGLYPIYRVKNKIYIKGYNKNYAIDIKTFKKSVIKKLPPIPKEKKEKDIYYSKTDGNIYYKSHVTKAKEELYHFYKTDKYIIATALDTVYVYNKKLNLLGKILLDKRVYTTSCSKDDFLYYSIYDKIYRYKIGF